MPVKRKDAEQAARASVDSFDGMPDTPAASYGALCGVFWFSGRLQKVRAWGVAVLANPGSVLVIGGVDQGDAPIADVMVYWP